MLEFSSINADNILEISKYYKHKKHRTCDYSLAGTFMWRKYFRSEYAICEDMLFCKVEYINNEICFTFPIGNGSIKRALELLNEYALYKKIAVVFCVVPENELDHLRDYYIEKSTFSMNRDWSDYLYTYSDLSNLAGRKYSGQRNHINKFKKLFPNYKYVKIEDHNIDRVKEYFSQYQGENIKDTPTAVEESLRTLELLDYFVKFKLVGGFIEVEDKIIAFSIGEIIKDTLYVHIEKALNEYPGSYQIIVKEFAKNNETDGVEYINREEDVGDIGLRTSKLSYHPVDILNKYRVEILS